MPVSSKSAAVAPRVFEGGFWKSTGNLVGNRGFGANIANLEAIGLGEVFKRRRIKRNGGSFITVFPAIIFTPLSMRQVPKLWLEAVWLF
ncbi:hypothetical protein CBI36_04475 [Acetobacter oryzifermentans]|uniref:Uncharacterized protein n=2 Tax=Acetobacter TaxID=434 RepID=A0AAN1PIA9_9PROT|nr:hypothetical protein CBI36_04475 [Acetobacter oryzifermentans]AXN00798.1 hypothetical protein CJF59_09740 [Acetobacter pomorum]